MTIFIATKLKKKKQTQVWIKTEYTFLPCKDLHKTVVFVVSQSTEGTSSHMYNLQDGTGFYEGGHMDQIILPQNKVTYIFNILYIHTHTHTYIYIYIKQNLIDIT